MHKCSLRRLLVARRALSFSPPFSVSHQKLAFSTGDGFPSGSRLGFRRLLDRAKGDITTQKATAGNNQTMGALRQTLSFGFLAGVVAITRSFYESSVFDTAEAW